MMDARTKAALEGSIEKWRKIVAGTGVDGGAKNCPLCVEYRGAYSDATICVGCPVRANSGYSGCRMTPYDKWMNENQNLDRCFPLRADTTKLVALAQAELDFLISLREPEAKP